MFHFCSYDHSHPRSASVFAQPLDFSCLSHPASVLSHLATSLARRPAHASVFPPERRGTRTLQRVRLILMVILEPLPALPVIEASWPVGGVILILCLALLPVLTCLGSLQRQPASRPCAAT